MEELISKKEILEIYGISYGALYRWKRNGLIPEEWFIKKSVITGQETFFPKSLICERIELIKKQKDDVSLEELSKRLSSEAQNNKTLVIDTVLGRKTFYLSDIKSVAVDEGNGKIRKIDIIGGEE